MDKDEVYDEEEKDAQSIYTEERQGDIINWDEPDEYGFEIEE